MATPHMNIREMISLCYSVSGMENAQIRVTSHEIIQEFEYISFVNLMDREPRPKHRIRKFEGNWKFLY